MLPTPQIHVLIIMPVPVELASGNLLTGCEIAQIDTARCRRSGYEGAVRPPSLAFNILIPSFASLDLPLKGVCTTCCFTE